MMSVKVGTEWLLVTILIIGSVQGGDEDGAVSGV